MQRYIPQPMEMNEQMLLAEKYVEETGLSLFLTGKAGTGKTTFLHYIVGHCHKRLAVVAPTGVAAVNAGGVTIHSFFQLPLCPYLPDVPELMTEYQMPDQHKQLRKQKVDIIRTLELLIIDEISMVRADLLDAVDATLRRYRRSSRPFGGVQLLMIGDVQQLPPVVTDDEKPYIERVYPSPFFFHSKALQRLAYITIQLTTVYRQQDPTFLSLLNHIRDNQFDPDTLRQLNQRVSANGVPPDAILLTTHNYQADRVNKQRMEALTTPPFTLAASVTGNFPESSAPTDSHLTLKPGAKVMFVKNDSSGGNHYYNGKLAVVEGLHTDNDGSDTEERSVWVTDDEGNTIVVKPERWENIKYEIDPSDNQIKPTVDGTFIQYPLKPAWAVTIHKAQGLTFDRVCVDASEAFAFGQVYVALSRCRTLEGLTLLSPINPHSAFGNNDVARFTASATPYEQASSQLDAYRTAYFYQELFDLFDFSALQHYVERLHSLFQSHLLRLYPDAAASLAQAAAALASDVVSVSERFRQQLSSIGQLPSQQAKPLVADRVAKAAPYFATHLQQIDHQVRPSITLSVDNKEVSKRLKEAATAYDGPMRLKQHLLSVVQKEGFDIAGLQKAKADFALQKARPQSAPKQEPNYGAALHPQMIGVLSRWRSAQAQQQEVPAYVVLQQKTLLAIANRLPQSPQALLGMPGFGPAKMQKYGAELLQLVADYVAGHPHETPASPAPRGNDQPAPAAPRRPSKEESVRTAARLFAEGQTIDSVAKQMGRAESTVQSYLLSALKQGLLTADHFLTLPQQAELREALLSRGDYVILRDLYDHYAGRYSFLQLRVARWLTQNHD